MSVLLSLQGTAYMLRSNLLMKLPALDTTVDLSNQIMVVTGANTGLGFESSLHLSRLGLGKLIMAVRTPAKGEEARKKILKSTGRPQSSIEVWTIDMESYDSVKAFAARATQLPRLDGVLANAGIMTTTFSLSEGNERTLNVNVISIFLLYLLLLPKMRESEKQTGQVCRYVIPNSTLHYIAPLSELQSKNNTIFERLNNPKTANMAGRYPLTKLLILYAVREAAERSSASGKGPCIINTPDPSFCKSNLASDYNSFRAFQIMENLIARTTEEGGRVLVHGLLSGQESNGKYLANCHVETPARNVTSKWGQRVQKQFFNELLEKLDKIQPGISTRL